jgi:hypothetical protein
MELESIRLVLQTCRHTCEHRQNSSSPTVAFQPFSTNFAEFDFDFLDGILDLDFSDSLFVRCKSLLPIDGDGLVEVRDFFHFSPTKNPASAFGYLRGGYFGLCPRLPQSVAALACQ